MFWTTFTFKNQSKIEKNYFHTINGSNVLTYVWNHENGNSVITIDVTRKQFKDWSSISS